MAGKNKNKNKIRNEFHVVSMIFEFLIPKKVSKNNYIIYNHDTVSKILKKNLLISGEGIKEVVDVTLHTVVIIRLMEKSVVDPEGRRLVLSSSKEYYITKYIF